MALTILVVDDEVDIRTELAEYLEMKGYRVEVASDGFEALEKFEAAPVDVLIADVKMPRFDGYELIRRLRPMHPDLPIILMTGHFSQSDRVKAEKLGATIVMEKPISLRMLTKFLKRWNGTDDE